MTECAPNDIWTNTPAAGVPNSGLTAVDLFAGIGGFHIAAKYNGVRVTFASEIDKPARYCYELNLGLAPHGDIRQCKQYIPEHDILMAGFPCQPFSIKGKGRGVGDSQGRGALLWEVLNITKRMQPKAIIMENVKRFSTHNQGKTLESVTREFRKCGYTPYPAILNALDFGLPQKRERTFIVALQDGVGPLEWPASQGKPPALCSVLEREAVPDRYCASTAIRDKRRAKHKTDVRPAVWHENISKSVTSHPYSLALQAAASYNYLLVDGERRFTEREMLRLQGFPETYIPTGTYTQTKRQTGNAVPVPVASSVLAAVIRALRVSQVHMDTANM